MAVLRKLASNQFIRDIVLAALALLIVLLRSRPLSFWELDELLFAAGIQQFDPLRHHPHAPGYPVFIALGKMVHFFIPDVFTAMVTLSIMAAVAGFVLLTLAFRMLLKDDRLAIAGAFLFYVGPGMLVHAPLPLSDASALALLALTFYAASTPPVGASRGAAVLLGTAGSLAVGCRPQLAVLVLPLLLFAAVQHRSWRRAAVVGGSFTALSLVWLLPLVAATGGPSGFMGYQLRQASWFALHDAALARAGHTWFDLAFRFVAHPWGPKLLSFPVLSCAAIGLLWAVRRAETQLVPVLGACGVYLIFVLTTNDPADGVRYALPAAIATSLLAARGWGWLRTRPQWMPALGLALGTYAAASMAYVAPVLRPRHTSPSPPVQAARHARASLPKHAVILYEPSLKPHAEMFMSTFRNAPIRAGYGDLDEQLDTPVYLYGEGGGRSAPSAKFSWPASDAYGKLTRNHYRVVSLVEVPPQHRYRAIRGVRQPDRAPGGDEWRWLEQIAEISLPDLGATTGALELTLPADSPLESNHVKAFVNGQLKAEANIRRGLSTKLMLPLPDGRRTVRIESEREIEPGRRGPGGTHVPRGVSVMLMDVNQRASVRPGT